MTHALPRAARRAASTANRPSVEAMEPRLLLTATAYLYSNSASVVEHGTASMPMNFTVALTAASSQPVTVQYQTVAVSGKAGVDYVAAAGTLTIPAGKTSAVLPVTVLPDAAATSNKTFTLKLAGAQGASVLTAALTGTVVEQNTPPPASVSVASQTATLGVNGAAGTMTFTFVLNEAVSTPVSFTASTADVTAKAGVNYAAKSQVLTFAPGQTTVTFTVSLYGSTTASTKIFLIDLTNSNVKLAATQTSGVVIY